MAGRNPVSGSVSGAKKGAIGWGSRNGSRTGFLDQIVGEKRDIYLETRFLSCGRCNILLMRKVRDGGYKYDCFWIKFMA